MSLKKEASSVYSVLLRGCNLLLLSICPFFSFEQQHVVLMKDVKNAFYFFISSH